MAALRCRHPMILAGAVHHGGDAPPPFLLGELVPQPWRRAAPPPALRRAGSANS
jgi:hypothetical protein